MRCFPVPSRRTQRLTSELETKSIPSFDSKLLAFSSMQPSLHSRTYSTSQNLRLETQHTSPRNTVNKPQHNKKRHILQQDRVRYTPMTTLSTTVPKSLTRLFDKDTPGAALGASKCGGACLPRPHTRRVRIALLFPRSQPTSSPFCRGPRRSNHNTPHGTAIKEQRNSKCNCKTSTKRMKTENKTNEN